MKVFGVGSQLIGCQGQAQTLASVRNINQMGNAHVRQVAVVKSVNIMGSGVVSDSTVGKNVDIMGNASIVRSKIGGRVDVKGSFELKDSEVDNKINVGGTVTIKGAEVGRLESGGNAEIIDSNIFGQVKVGGNLESRDSTIRNNVRVSGTAIIHGSEIIGFADIYGSAVIKNSSFLSGDILGELTLIGSKIDGELKTSSRVLVVDSSEVGSIFVRKQSRQNLVITGGNVSSSIFSESVVRTDFVRVTAGRTAMVNGFRVTANFSSTTVTTPEGYIYINGSSISEGVPSSYADYQKQNGQAIQVTGPGWKNGEETNGVQEKTPPREIVTLRNGSVVAGEIYFESGNGKVIVEEGSRFEGLVVGGAVEDRNHVGEQEEVQDVVRESVNLEEIYNYDGFSADTEEFLTFMRNAISQIYALGDAEKKRGYLSYIEEYIFSEMTRMDYKETVFNLLLEPIFIPGSKGRDDAVWLLKKLDQNGYLKPKKKSKVLADLASLVSYNIGEEFYSDLFLELFARFFTFVSDEDLKKSLLDKITQPIAQKMPSYSEKAISVLIQVVSQNKLSKEDISIILEKIRSVENSAPVFQVLMTNLISALV